MKEAILIIDENSSKSSVAEVLQDKLQYNVRVAANGEMALRSLNEGYDRDPNLIVLSIKGNGERMYNIVRGIRALKPAIPLITLVSYGDEETGAKTLHAGASDFLTKPVAVERLHHSISMLLKIKQMGNYMSWLERRISGHIDFSDLIGKHPLLMDAVLVAKQAATSKIPVWIEGKSGTEKELFARAIHGSSDRAGKPFVAINCQMLPANKADALLFGQEHIAHDSNQFSLGKIREADHGTLLLEEVYDLPESSQRLLLDFIETDYITPVGSKNKIKLDVRIICSTSTSANIKNSAEQNKKLFDRLKSVVISLPSLAERQSDISELVEHYIASYSASQMKYVRGVTPQAMHWLKNQAWLGNTQQLSNMIWRAVMTATGELIDVGDLNSGNIGNGKLEARGIDQVIGSNLLVDNDGRMKTLRSVQEEAIRFALQYSGGSMTRAAKSLGIGRSTLYRKLDEFKINNYISRANQTTRPMMTVSSIERS